MKYFKKTDDKVLGLFVYVDNDFPLRWMTISLGLGFCLLSFDISLPDKKHEKYTNKYLSEKLSDMGLFMMKQWNVGSIDILDSKTGNFVITLPGSELSLLNLKNKEQTWKYVKNKLDELNRRGLYSERSFDRPVILLKDKKTNKVVVELLGEEMAHFLDKEATIDYMIKKIDGLQR